MALAAPGRPDKVVAAAVAAAHTGVDLAQLGADTAAIAAGFERLSNVVGTWGDTPAFTVRASDVPEPEPEPQVQATADRLVASTSGRRWRWQLIWELAASIDRIDELVDLAAAA